MHISRDGFVGSGRSNLAPTPTRQSNHYSTQSASTPRFIPTDYISIASLSQYNFVNAKTTKAVCIRLGLDGFQVRLRPSAAELTALDGHGRARASHYIDWMGASRRCCNMRAHHNRWALDGHRREVEFGYSRESAWLLTETTITWQGRTKLGVECASKTCTASTIQSHQEPSSVSLSNTHTCRAHRSAALPKTTLLLNTSTRRQR